jgi:hypothetical protein
MSPRKQVNAPKKPKRPKTSPKTSRRDRDWVLNSGIVVSTLLMNVAQCAPLLGVQHAAQAAAMVFNTIEKVKANKEDYEIIANDAGELIIAIWRLQEKSENPKKWASPEIRDMVGNLKTALEEVNTIAKRQAMRNMLVRIIFNMTDAGRIRQTREMIVTAVSRFQVLSHIKMNELLLEVAAKQQELSEGMKYLTTPRVEEEEEEEEEDEDEEEEEEEEEFSHLPRRETSSAIVGPNFHGVSISNESGYMFNSNMGNFANTIVSNVGNNNSRNYYG